MTEAERSSIPVHDTATVWAAVTATFLAATLVLTWPQATNPSGVPPHPDSWFSMWRLAWVAHQLPRDPVHLFDANIHFPERGTLAYSDALLFQGVAAAPLIWLGVPTPVVYNLLVSGSFLFAGLAMYALVRRVTGSRPAGMIAGLIFAFSPYRFDHYMHLELLWSGWMPLAILLLLQVLERGTVKAGAVLGATLAAQALSCIYYGVLFSTVLTVPVTILVASLPAHRRARAACSLAVGGVLAALILLPYVQPYRQAKTVVGERNEGEVRLYSAGPGHYLSATPGSLLYGEATAGLGRPEKRLFPGLVACALAIVAIWPPIDRRRVAAAAALLLAVDLSFGLNGLTFGWLRDHIEVYRGLRVPARAGQIALLFVAVLAGGGLARLEALLPQAGARRRLLGLTAGVFVLAESVVAPLDLVQAPGTPGQAYRWLARQPRGVAAELPMPEEHTLPLYDGRFAYRSTFHWHPLLNGYSGNVPSSYVQLLRAVTTFPSDAAVRALIDAGARYVIVHERLYGTRRYRAIAEKLRTWPGLVPHGPFADQGWETMVYSVRRAPHE